MVRTEDSERQIIAHRFNEAELLTDRFNPVKDGSKTSYSHEQRYSDPVEVPGENYGIYADEEDELIVIDVDDYRSEVDEKVSSIQAINRLPPTLEVETPHGGTHKFYRVYHPDELSPATVLADRLGVRNPVPSWGEIQAASKYVVGAGSQLSSCSKESCDSCAEADGGHYRIQSDRPIATITSDALVKALATDPKLSDSQAAETEAPRDGSNKETVPSTTSETETTSQEEDTDISVTDEWLDEELLLEALDHIDPNCGYNKWRNIGFAIADVVEPKTRAKQVYKNWSKGCPKWDDDAERLVEDIIDRAESGGVSAGTIVYHAKNEGWSPSKNIEHLLEEYCTDGDDTIPFWLVRQVAVEFDICSADEFVEQEAGDGGTYPGFPDAEAYNETLGAIENAGYKHGREYHGDGRSESDRKTKKNEDTQNLPVPNRFKLRNGCYYKADSEGNERRVTNWQLEVVSRLTHEDGSREIELRVHPASREAYDVIVPPTVFNEFGKFRKEVLKGFSSVFSGSREDLNALKEFVGTQETAERTGTEHLGLHDDEFVVPSGSITVNGWTDDPQFVYINDRSPLNEKTTLSPEMAVEDVDQDAVAEIVELLPQIRRLNRFLPVLGWFYAAPVRPLIHEWENEFNLLSVLGDTGAGKTTTLETLWQLFGMDDDLVEVNSTKYSCLAALTSTNSIPVVFDEYKPADIDDQKLDDLHHYFRVATKGGVESKGNPDFSTTNFRFRAPVCIAGEQPVRGPAEKRRTIMTTFKREVTVGSTSESRAYAKLAGGNVGDTYYEGYDLQQHALLFYQWLLQQDQDELKALWQDCREKTIANLSQQNLNLASLDDLVLQGFQTVRFGCNLYRNFAEHLGIDPDTTLVTETAIDEAIKYIASEGGGSNHTSHLDKFLELCCRAATADYLTEGEHYRIMVANGEGRPELRLTLNTAFDQVRRYARDHDVRGEDLLDTGDDYRARIRDNEQKDDGYITTTSKVTRLEKSRRRCIGIDIPCASDQVSGFEIQAFTDANDIIDSTEFTPHQNGGNTENSPNGTKSRSTTYNKQLDTAIQQSVAAAEEDEGASREEIIVTVARECNVSQNRVENRITTLLAESRGIYERPDGRLRRV